MKIALLGDISLNGRFDISNSSDVKLRLTQLKEKLEDCDFVIANLESPLTEKNTQWFVRGHI